ncbi:TPA: hypothetical protein UL761_000249 [Stenotrophomonas maltophilia]|nr:hypothetical protein [Stenotrophomonas maltophilia]
MSAVMTHSFNEPIQKHFTSNNAIKGHTSPFLGVSLGVALGISVAGVGMLALSTTGNAYNHVPVKKGYVITAGGEVLQAKAAPAVDSTPEWRTNLVWIKNEADVTISALSDLFGVTRRAFYSWLDGTTPKRGGSQARIAVLRDVLSSLPNREQRTSLFALAGQAVDGVSFREVFQGSTDDVDELRERLDVMVAKLAPALEQQERRFDRRGGASKSFETDFSAA